MRDAPHPCIRLAATPGPAGVYLATGAQAAPDPGATETQAAPSDHGDGIEPTVAAGA